MSPIPPPAMPAAGIRLSRLWLHSPTATLLRDADLSLSPGDKVGLVGRNGSGKTTLLETLAAIAEGRTSPAHSRHRGGVAVTIPTGIGYLPQAPRLSGAATVAGYLAACATGPARAHERHQILTSALGPTPDAALLTAWGDSLEEMAALDAWDFPARRARVVGALLGDVSALDRPLATVSGGEATRVALAGIMLSSPGVVLLDEPTNSLDEAGVEVLTEWLRKSSAATLVVSHDRQFLDDVVDAIVEIDEHSQTLRRFGGNHSFYERRKAEEFAAQVRRHEDQERERERLLRDAARLAQAAQRFQTGSQDDYFRARGKKVAARATAQRRRLERQLDKVPPPLKPGRPRIAVPPLQTCREVLVQAAGAAVTYPGAIAAGLEPVSLTIHGGERVGITGRNGVGKTTLLRTLVGELQPTAGSVERRHGLRIAHLAQVSPDPLAGETVIAYARRLMPLRESEIRTLAGKVILTDVGRSQAGALSAGQRRRLEIALLFAAGPEMIVLDEPTNHLDLPTIEMLETALAEYAGAVVAASHDRRFLAGLRLDRVLSLRSPR